MAGAQPDEQPQLSILRIKRKRTDQPTPLDALVIEHAQPPSTKRRKNNPADSTPQAAAAPSRGIFRFAETVPLDSFSTPTKTRSLRDRIQSFLAHPPPALSRQHSSSSLRSLARDRDREASPSSSSLAPRKPAPGSPARRKLPSALRAAREAAASGSSAPASPLGPSSGLPSTSSSFGLSPSSSSSTPSSSSRSPAAPGPSRADAAHASRAALRYRVVERRRAESYALERAREADEVRRGLRPPTVRDAREVEREREEEREGERERSAGLRVYEAEAVVDGEGGEGRGAAKAAAATRRKKATAGAVAPLLKDEQADGDTAMDRFGEMLDEYLSLQESITPSTTLSPLSSTASSRRAPAIAPAADSDDDDSDADSDSGASFVYDVYYRAAPAPAPAAASASAPTAGAGPGAQGVGAGAGIGVGSSELPGGEVGSAGAWDVSSLAGLTRIGQLAGLDPDEDDAALLLLHSASSRAGGGGADSGDSDEEEDCADQDSNEENDYRNDYPDEEDADLDEGFDADDAAAWRESVRGAGPRAGGEGRGAGGGGGWSDEDDEDEDGEGEGEGDDEGMSDEGWSD